MLFLHYFLLSPSEESSPSHVLHPLAKLSLFNSLTPLKYTHMEVCFIPFTHENTNYNTIFYNSFFQTIPITSRKVTIDSFLNPVKRS